MKQADTKRSIRAYVKVRGKDEWVRNPAVVKNYARSLGYRVERDKEGFYVVDDESAIVLAYGFASLDDVERWLRQDERDGMIAEAEGAAELPFGTLPREHGGRIAADTGARVLPFKQVGSIRRAARDGGVPAHTGARILPFRARPRKRT
jgi:hypothetical protein